MKKIITSIAIVAVVFTACKKEEAEPEVEEVVIATTEPAATVSYAATVAPIISTNCNGSSCHGTTASNLDTYVTYDGLKAIAANGKLKKEVVTNQSMPLGKTLTAAQITDIDNWITQGALNN
jgi:PBP1b-binding outer membrane lipoprotein LpoB